MPALTATEVARTEGADAFPEAGAMLSLRQKGGLMDEQERRRRRWELISDALEEDRDRLARARDSRQAYIAMGSALFWVVAADEGWRKATGLGYSKWRNHGPKDRKQLFQGLRYPRNVLAHESEAWEPQFGDIVADTSTALVGAWVWGDVPRPPPRPEWQRQHVAYLLAIKGRPVVDVVSRAIEELHAFWRAHGPR